MRRNTMGVEGKALDSSRDGFLYHRGGYLVWLVLLLGLLVNGTLAVRYVTGGEPLWAGLAILSIFIIPRATFGLILLVGRKSQVRANMPLGFAKLFPSTYRNYGGFGVDALVAIGDPYAEMKAYLCHVAWLALGLVPLAVFFIER
jgi:hypothetical protein